MKLKKDLLPILALMLMILLDVGYAFLLVQVTGNPIYLTLAVVSLPLFLVILFVVFFRLKKEPEAE
jgi:fatty acid desaturase